MSRIHPPLRTSVKCSLLPVVTPGSAGATLAGMDTMSRASEIRAAVRRLGPRGKGRRYPEELKRDVLA